MIHKMFNTSDESSDIFKILAQNSDICVTFSGVQQLHRPLALRNYSRSFLNQCSIPYLCFSLASSINLLCSSSLFFSDFISSSFAFSSAIFFRSSLSSSLRSITFLFFFRALPTILPPFLTLDGEKASTISNKTLL